MLTSNYSAIEARYPTEDLLAASLRRTFNLTLAWLHSMVDKETWDKDYAKYFMYDKETQRQMDLRDKQRGSAPDKRATIKLGRKPQPTIDGAIE